MMADAEKKFTWNSCATVAGSPDCDRSRPELTGAVDEVTDAGARAREELGQAWCDSRGLRQVLHPEDVLLRLGQPGLQLLEPLSVAAVQDERNRSADPPCDGFADSGRGARDEEALLSLQGLAHSA